MKQELEILRRGKIEHESVLLPTRSYYSGPKVQEDPWAESFDSSLFGVSTFCSNWKHGEVQRG